MTFLRTPPKPPTGAASDSKPLKASMPLTSSTATDEALDELTALFLTPAASESRHTSAPATTELLITGHMPVRGNLWVLPYADAVASESGCCTVVTLNGDDEIALDVLRGEHVKPLRAQSVHDTVHSLVSTTQRWMLRPTAPVQFDQVVRADADRVTILTGTDGIAVVAAYKIIKDLAAAAADANVTLNDVGVVVVGADEQAAKEMVRRLNLTASSFLDADVKLRRCISKIDAGTRGTQHLDIVGEPCPNIDEVISWIRDADAPTEESESTSVEHDATFAPTPDDQEPEPFVTKTEREHLTSMHSNGNGETIGKLQPKVVEQSRQPVVEDSPASQLLVEHVDGLAAIGPRCPGQESIELAVDTRGALHLLGREKCLREMRIVKAWVESHASLLVMACGEDTIDTQQDVVCHIFSDTPASLADLHGTGLRLHVLAPVGVGDHVAWYSAPLN